MKRFICSCLMSLEPLFGALVSGSAHAAEDCDPRFAKSAQLATRGCQFQNPPNPDLKPNRSNWDIWSPHWKRWTPKLTTSSSWGIHRTYSNCMANGG